MEREEERYPGERRVLALFLRDLQPAVARELGQRSLLYGAIQRALREPRLRYLRHARALFNHLPRPVRRRLSQHLLARRDRSEPEESAPRPTDAPLRVRFEAQERQDGLAVRGLEPEQESDAPDIRVLIRADVLPGAAARRLRELAEWLEQDRRLLSRRFWLDNTTALQSPSPSARPNRAGT